ncbi:MAG TPA: DPP IV N-terminal domain-containing protein [Vicinamibacterales bacterium]|nr:DPP IV N-terminal domain-containing protein [Vicinamibacterales bacterium]
MPHAHVGHAPATNYADIYTVNVDGTGLRQLTSNPRSDTYPAWSPDGQWIAYVGYRGDFDNGLWVMRSDGTQRRRITLYTHDSVPTWEPRT